MTKAGQDSLKTRKSFTVDEKEYDFFSLKEAEKELGDLSKLPVSLRILLENLLRNEDGKSVTLEDIKAFPKWLENGTSNAEIAFRPARVLMQDFTGVPAVVDLAAMREAMTALDADPEKINPLSAVDLVIDHSVMVDEFGTPQAFQHNVEREYERNGERYAFLNWGQKAFKNFSVVPPGTGICHQVNLEYIGQVAWIDQDDNNPEKTLVYPDTLVGTDSHTTMIDGLGILGWGVGGIEAEAAMLGQPISMVIPDVVGFKITGSLPEGATATDLVLTVTQMLREKGVVGKFVEFYGDGLSKMSLPDRATIGNMSPEFGCTAAFFPVDSETIRYLKFTGRDEHRVNLAEAYHKEQGLWRDEDTAEPVFTDTLELDLGEVEPSIAGPKRPQDKIPLSLASEAFKNLVAKDAGCDPVGEDGKFMSEAGQLSEEEAEDPCDKKVTVKGEDYKLEQGSVVIAAITSCTNTSNPSVMLGAGLVAKKARDKGLEVPPWVKTSLAPGSKVVTDYLEKAGLDDDLNKLGFNLVGYGCTTCIGNSGPLADDQAEAVEKGNLTVTSVLSGNRNFEGRISPHVKANYLASPPLVVAYALAGNMKKDIFNDPIGKGKDGEDVYLKDIWPANDEIKKVVEDNITPDMFRERYDNVFEGTKEWQEIGKGQDGKTYKWDDESTYIKNPPFFEGMTKDVPEPKNVEGARCLALLGDSITTDHISPAGAIKKDSPAGEYLMDKGVEPKEFNSYGSRRGNHEVMMRGTFANVRIMNEMLATKDGGGVEGGFTEHVPSGEKMSIYDAAMKYIEDETPLVVIAGKEYGTGSSRDWAAKGTLLLGVKAVVAESYERIHRSNLIGMGVLPLQFVDEDRKSLNLTGREKFDITGIEGKIEPRQKAKLTVTYDNGSTKETDLLVRIDTADERDYYINGGILHYVLRNLASS